MDVPGQRVEFVFDAAALAALDQLKESMGAASRAEVVRRALRFLHFALELDRRGGTVLFREPDGKERSYLF